MQYVKIMILVMLTFYSRPVAITQPLLAEEECMGCILQRQGKLSYIIRRWINPQTGPDENESFGHCFFCVQCPNQITPSCWGWWPSSPDGGDYEGDDGMLQPDRTESWDTAACRSLSLKKAEKIMDQLENYEDKQKHKYLPE